MVDLATVLQAGPLTSPPALLVGLVVLAVIVLVGRVLLALAWRLVLLALIALAVLWLLATLGFETGVFNTAASAWLGGTASVAVEPAIAWFG